MSSISDFEENYINRVIEVNILTGEEGKTGILNANPIICISQAEDDLNVPKLLEKFLSVYGKASVSKRVMQKEIEPRGISLKPFYNMPNIVVIDTIDQDMSCARLRMALKLL